jgi:acyl-ACP thioesterase
MITYYDLDCNGKLKFSAFLRMVHIAADENAKELGVGFADLAPRGMTFVLQRFSAIAAALPPYAEAVEINTWPAAIERGTFIRKGEMRDKKSRKLMEWASLWLLFDLNERKILRPSALHVELTGLGDMGTTVTPEKIDLPAGWPEWGQPHHAYAHTVRRADVDTNMHMNNSIYGDLVTSAVLMPSDWAQFHINYLAETRLEDEIAVTSRVSGNEILIAGEANNRRSFTARVVYTNS